MSSPREHLDDETRAVLLRRARRLAEPQRSVAPPAADQAVHLEVNGRRFLVPSWRVREILPPGPVATIPGRAHELRGVRATRSGAVVLADLSALSGHGNVAAPESCLVVVLDAPEPLGLLADRAVTAEPAEGAFIPSDTSALAGRVTADGVLALDVDALLGDPRLRATRSTVRLSTVPHEGKP